MANSKLIKFNDDARSKVMIGAKKVYDAVSVTLGPAGRNVMIAKDYESPTVTKDGVTVAKEVILKDPFENAGAQMVINGCSSSNDKAGDGSSTATVLSYSIAKEGMKAVDKGANAIDIQRGINKAVDFVVKELKGMSKEVSGSEDIKAVATISANGDSELGALVAEAIEKVGKDGTIVPAESKTMETTVKVVEGMKFDNGFLSAYFATDQQTMTTEFQDAFILVTDKSIGAMKDLIPILEKVAAAGKPLLIIADNVEGEALTTLLVNNMRGAIKSCAVKAPGYGDARDNNLQDIAILTGATLVSDKFGIKFDTLKLENLGKCSSVKITKEDTTIVGGQGNKEKIAERISEIKARLETETSNSEKEVLQSRIGKLAGGVAVIELGAVTETEMKEKKFRLEDTLAATRAAVEEGIIPGGGTPLAVISERMTSVAAPDGMTSDEMTGWAIVEEAIKLPLKKIAENSGVSGEVVINEVLKANINVKDNNLIGYNARTGKFENFIETGIIDPTKVTRCALQNAASVAGMMLTTECVIVPEPEEKKDN